MSEALGQLLQVVGTLDPSATLPVTIGYNGVGTGKTYKVTPQQIVVAGGGSIGQGNTITQTYTGDGSAGQLLYLEAFDNTQGGTATGNNFDLRSEATSFGTPNNEWHLIGVNLIEAGGCNIGGYYGTPVGIYSRVQKLSAPIGNTTVRVSVGTGSSTTLQVNDVTNFSWSYPNSVGAPVSSSNPLPVKVNGTLYQCIGCTSNSGTLYPTGYLGAVAETGVPAFSGTSYNTDSYVKGGYQAGGYAGPGTLTFSTAISETDGEIGNTVVAQVIGDAMECLCLEMRDVSGLPSSLSGQPSVLEIDLGVSGPDDVGSRRFISCFPNFTGGAGNPYTSAGFDAVLFANPASNDVYFNRGIWLNLGTILEHGIDLSGSQFGTAAHGVTLPVDVDVAWYSSPSYQGGIRLGSVTTVTQGSGGNAFSFGQFNGNDVGNGYFGCGLATRTVVPIGSTGTLTVGNVGCIYEQTGSTTFSTYLPLAANVPVGIGYVIYNASSVIQNVVCSGSDQINNIGGTLTLNSNDAIVIVSNGSANSYYVITRGNTAGVLSLAVSTGTIAAAGSNQATATVMTAQDCLVNSGTGGIELYQFGVGVENVVRNRTGSTINIFPQSGGQIENAGTNIPVTIGSGETGRYRQYSSTQWYF